MCIQSSTTVIVLWMTLQTLQNILISANEQLLSGSVMDTILDTCSHLKWQACNISHWTRIKPTYLMSVAADISRIIHLFVLTTEENRRNLP